MAHANWRPLLFSGLWLFSALAWSKEPSRSFEVYSDLRFDEDEGDYVGAELEVLLWEGSATATLTLSDAPDPFRLAGTAAGQELLVSASQDDLQLELKGSRKKTLFVGSLTLKRKGEMVWTRPVRLPRKRPPKSSTSPDG